MVLFGGILIIKRTWWDVDDNTFGAKAGFNSQSEIFRLQDSFLVTFHSLDYLALSHGYDYSYWRIMPVNITLSLCMAVLRYTEFFLFHLRQSSSYIQLHTFFLTRYTVSNVRTHFWASLQGNTGLLESSQGEWGLTLWRVSKSQAAGILKFTGDGHSSWARSLSMFSPSGSPIFVMYICDFNNW